MVLPANWSIVEVNYYQPNDITNILPLIHTDYAVIYTNKTKFTCDPSDVIMNHVSTLGKKWIVSGHLMNKQGQYCGLHEQFMLLNIKELDPKEYNQRTGTAMMLCDYMAGPSIHDDYTPEYVEPRGSMSVYENQYRGWNLINYSLSCNIPVKNISEQIRNIKTFDYS